MPAWPTHIVIANIVAKKIKIDENSFIFGNIFPDIDNAIFVPDVTNKFTHEQTHFTRKEDIKTNEFNMKNIEYFMKEYANKLENPIVLGSLIHIITDDLWNKKAFEEHYIYDENRNFIGAKLADKTIMKCERKTATRMKQLEFNIFGNKLLKKYNVKIPEYTTNLLEYSKEIKEIPITDEDIKKTITFLENMKKNIEGQEEYQYEMFKEEELEELFENTIKFVIEKVLQ